VVAVIVGVQEDLDRSLPEDLLEEFLVRSGIHDHPDGSFEKK
jgi:hypothetical protein